METTKADLVFYVPLNTLEDLFCKDDGRKAMTTVVVTDPHYPEQWLKVAIPASLFPKAVGKNCRASD